jgi:Holliday junction resolvase
MSRGLDFERRVAEILRERGWYVTRSAGSHGDCDLIAISPHEIAFIECKLGGPRRLAPAAWNVLYHLAMGAGGVPLLVHRPARGRIVFERLLGPKIGRPGLRPACEPWIPEELPAGWCEAPRHDQETGGAAA